MRTLLFISACIFFCTVANARDLGSWKFTAGGAIYSSPVADESCVYFGSHDSLFYALDKASGKIKWKFRTGGPIKSKPCFFEEYVVFNSADGKIYALDRKKGKKKWKFQTGGEKVYDMWDYYLSSPVVYENKIYVGSGDSCIYALQASTGELVWKYKTGDVVHSEPLLADNKLFVGSFDGFFYALDAKTGSVIWKFDTIGDMYFPKGEVQKGAAIHGKAVIFGSRDYNIYALDMNTGNGLWNMKERGSWIIATPLVHQESLYFGTSDTHRFYCMEASSGEVKWTLPLSMRVYGTATASGDNIFFGCFDGKIYGVNAATGSVQCSFQTEESKSRYTTVYDEHGEFRKDFELYGPQMEQSEKTILSLGAILSSPLLENNTLYFGDANGHFYAVKLSIR